MKGYAKIFAIALAAAFIFDKVIKPRMGGTTAR